MDAWLRICMISALIGNLHQIGEAYYIGADLLLQNYDEAKGCGYKGYTPYLRPDIKMDHHMAQLYTTYLTDIYINPYFTKALGVAGAAGALEVPQKMDDLINSNTVLQKLIKVKKLSRATIKILLQTSLLAAVGMMTPALGLFCAVLGAVQNVENPTHRDILDATNKAINKITEEVDFKLGDMKMYVNEKVHEANKDQVTFNYKYLVTYWSLCSQLETEDEQFECQKLVLTQAIASRDIFLLHNNVLDKVEAKFEENQLDDTMRRAIEVNMLSFRNYGIWLHGSIKSLADQYETAYDKEINKTNTASNKGISGKKTTPMTCEEQLILKLQKKDGNVSTSLKYHCLFKRELITQAIYFEKYAIAAIEEIKTVARHRLEKPLEKNLEIRFHNVTDMDRLTNSNAEKVSGAQCQAKIHPVKVSDCRYDVRLNGKSVSKKDIGFVDGIVNKGGIDWRLDSELKDGELIRSIDKDPKTARQWCKARIEKRREEYMKLEQYDIERYWSQEVLSVMKCGRLLATGETSDCLNKTMQKYEPKAFETSIKLRNATGRSIPNPGGRLNTPENAIDSTLSTVFISSNKDPSWSADLVKPAFVKEIHIYRWKLDKIRETASNATAVVCQIGQDPYCQTKNSKGTELKNGSYIFAWHDMGLVKMVLTTNTGTQIKSGWLNETSQSPFRTPGHGHDSWRNPGTWTENDNQYQVINFRGKKDRCVLTKGWRCCRFPFTYNSDFNVSTECVQRQDGSSWCAYGHLTGETDDCRPEKHYATKDSGRCDEPVRGKEECRDILRLESPHDGTFTEKTFESHLYPPGCYRETVYHDYPYYYFNANFGSQANCSKKHVCVCKADMYSHLSVSAVSTVAGIRKTTVCLQPTAFPRYPESYDEPLVVPCPFNANTPAQEKINIKIDTTKWIPKKKQSLYLAEVRVMGFLPYEEEPTRGSTVMVDLINPQQSSTDGNSEALLAIDSELSTMSKTNRTEKYPWFCAELKTKTKVESIVAFLQGSYSTVELTVRSADSYHNTCGKKEPWSSSVEGFKQFCQSDKQGVNNFSNVNWVCVFATPEPDENNERSLMIRELQVYKDVPDKPVKSQKTQSGWVKEDISKPEHESEEDVPASAG